MIITNANFFSLGVVLDSLQAKALKLGLTRILEGDGSTEVMISKAMAEDGVHMAPRDVFLMLGQIVSVLKRVDIIDPKVAMTEEQRHVKGMVEPDPTKVN